MKHLKEQNAGYFEHMGVALGFAFKLSVAVGILVIHAIFPWWFEYTGSNIVNDISKEFKILFRIQARYKFNKCERN